MIPLACGAGGSFGDSASGLDLSDVLFWPTVGFYSLIFVAALAAGLLGGWAIGKAWAASAPVVAP